MKKPGKLKGFIIAMILAFASFLCLFLFFPDMADKYIGISLNNPSGTVSVNSRKPGHGK